MQLQISPRGVRLTAVPIEVISIDFRFDESRVWSVDLRGADVSASGEVELDWPEPLRPYLVGESRVSVRNSGTQEVLAWTEHTFSDATTRVEVRDADGNSLAINKWGRLGKTLDGADESFQDRIADRTQQIISELEGMKLRPFVVGGTLLGAVREGTLLPHDDDADVAYLSEHTNPADVALEGFRVGHELTRLGHHVVRHSATHMQLYFFTDAGAVDHYVDVFSAFFTEDGFLNQPFHVRGELRREQMLPFSAVSILGREFPAPHDPEAWLVINYDENWRTPIPGYKLATPRGTKRRFQNWFGSYHFHRDFWNEFYSGSAQEHWETGASWLRHKLGGAASSTIVDLGSGDGISTARLAAEFRESRVVGLDYSYNALKSAAKHGVENLEFGHLNLYRLKSLGMTRQFSIDGAFDITMNHLLEQVGGVARPTIWRLVRMSLRSGGRALATVNTQPVADVSFGDPTGWHLTPDEIRAEAAEYGLGAEFVQLASPGERGAPRAQVGIVFSIAEHAIEPVPERVTVKQRIKNVLRRSLMSSDAQEVEELKHRIEELERDLDSHRRDSLRVAELIDLVEGSFSTSAQLDAPEGKL